MKTAGFDIVLLLNENLLSQISGAFFYNNKLKINKVFDLKPHIPADTLTKIPSTLQDFLTIRYRIKLLFEPYINFTEGNKIEISAKLRVYLWMMQGLELKFDAALTLETPISVDTHTNKLNILLNSSDIKEFVIKYNYTPDTNITLQLNGLFESALHDYFNDPAENLQISLPSVNAQLPYTSDSDKIPVNVRAIQIVNSTTLAIAANLFGYTGGDPAQLTDFARNCNIGLGISEMAMNKVYNFFWAKMHWDRRFRKNGNFKVALVDKALNVVTDLINVALKVVKFASLGFIEAKLEFIDSDFEYLVDMTFTTKPTFDIQDGNRVRIYNLGVDLFIRIKMWVTFDAIVEVDTSGPVPDECTPWNDDIEISKERHTLLAFDLGVGITDLLIRSCTGEITIDEDTKALVCKVKELDVNLYDYVKAGCDFLLLPDSIKDRIMNSLKEKVVESIPPIVVSPTVFDLDIKFVPWKLNIEGRKLEITDNEAIVGAYVSFRELQNRISPVPKYIGNFNNMEVHRTGCDSIFDTYETHQRGYFVLQDALNDGYDGCKKCLPAFSKR